MEIICLVMLWFFCGVIALALTFAAICLKEMMAHFIEKKTNEWVYDEAGWIVGGDIDELSTMTIPLCGPLSFLCVIFHLLILFFFFVRFLVVLLSAPKEANGEIS